MTQNNHAETYNYIGQQIRTLREQSNLSQDALAQSIKVSANTISRWETATYKPSISDLEKLAKIFKVRLSYFFPSEEDEKSSQIQALLSATGELPIKDIEELVKYAEFRRARFLLEREQTKSKGKKNDT